MEPEGVLKLKGYIPNFSIWDDTINIYAIKFHEKYNIYPNILLASDDTYRKIDLYAQMHPDKLVTADGEENILSSKNSYEGISEFVAEDYVLDCCFDFDLTLGNFTLIFDEAPEFDGEPVPEVEEENKGKVYRFGKAA